MKYSSKRLAGLVKLRGRSYEEVYGVEKARQIKEKMRLAKLGKKMPWNKGHPKGDKHPRWKEGISRTYKTGYYSHQYKTWRTKVFERDGFTCQKCGACGYITAHHIKSFAHYPLLRFELSNGITLCPDCHSLTDNYRGRGRKKEESLTK